MPEHQPAQPEVATLPPVALPIPALASHMDDEEAALTLGLGLLVREAAAVEYVLHALLVHLDAVHLSDQPYAFEHETTTGAGKLITRCKNKIDAMPPDGPIPTEHRPSLQRHLHLCSDLLEERNRYVHGYWTWDPDTQSWLTVKGRHKKQGSQRFPEIEWATSTRKWLRST